MVQLDYLPPAGGSVIDPGLYPQTPENGNIETVGRRLSGIWRRPGRFRHPETFPNVRKPAKCGPFSANRAVYANVRTGWLGREDSNLRMVESKSGYALSVRTDEQALQKCRSAH